jgi:hypothetical protein
MPEALAQNVSLSTPYSFGSRPASSSRLLQRVYGFGESESVKDERHLSKNRNMPGIAGESSRLHCWTLPNSAGNGEETMCTAALAPRSKRVPGKKFARAFQCGYWSVNRCKVY